MATQEKGRGGERDAFLPPGRKGQKVKRSKVTFGDFPFLVEAWKRDCLLVLLEERIVFMMMKEDSIYYCTRANII